MKKTLTLFFLVISIFTAKSQLHSYGGDTIAINSSADPSAVVDVWGYCKNTGAANISVRWEIIDSASPGGWTFTGFCDKNNCYLFTLNSSHTFSLRPDSTGYMKLDVQSHCVPGSGHVKVRMWNTADSANSLLYLYYAINFSANSACASGITSVSPAQISIFPNPVKNVLKISVPQSLSNAKLEVYNLIGSKVLSNELNTRETEQEFDLSALDGGIYIARISENGKIVTTRRFNKVD